MSNEFIFGDFYIIDKDDLLGHWDSIDRNQPVLYIKASFNTCTLDTLSNMCKFSNGAVFNKGTVITVMNTTNLKFHEYFIDFLNPTDTELTLHYLEFGIEPEQLRTFLQEAYEMHNLLKEHLEKENNK